MPDNMLLVVQTPNRGGRRGHQFLVANIHPSEFDPSVFAAGKSDPLIIMLAIIQNIAVTKLRSGVATGIYVRNYADTYQVTHGVTQVELDFSLPTQKEVTRAALRLNRSFCQKQISSFLQLIEAKKRGIETTRTRLKTYRTKLKETDMMDGIRLHYEHVLVPDCLRDLHDIHLEIRSTQGKLKRMRTMLASLSA